MSEAIYGDDFFAFHRRWEPDYRHVADWLDAFLDWDTALDLGCGNGYIVASLRRAGRDAAGIEVARDAALPHMPADVRDHVYDHDFLRHPLDPADLVICTEVAEHITKAEGRRLVRVIARTARKWAFFTAATPGQGGHHHVNEQPHEYWVRKFQRAGMRLDDIKTHFARRILGEKMKTVSWIPKNVLIFQQVHGTI
jgi:SAM-dependent methyltransferase